MALTKVPQREILRRLLDSGKLTPRETETARRLFDDLVAGKIGGLSQAQSVWADRLFKEHGLSPARPGVVSDSKKRRDEAKRALAEFDAMPRPKKPPGKR